MPTIGRDELERWRRQQKHDPNGGSKRAPLPAILVWALALGLPALSASGSQVYRTMGIEVADVLTGTVLSAKLGRAVYWMLRRETAFDVDKFFAC